MLHNFPVFIKAEKIHCDILIASGPNLMGMKSN